MAEEVSDEFRARLRELVGSNSVRRFADDVGLPASTLQKYLDGTSIPGLANLIQIARRCGVTIDWLATSALPKYPDQGEASLPASDDLVMLPRYDVRASAGAGALALTEGVTSYFAVERDWLRRALPSWAPPNAKIGMLEGGGDSMEPTIRDGDLLIIVLDPPEYVVDAGGIFVVRHHEHVRIKRVHVDMISGDVSLISDNPRYPVEIVRKDRVEFDLQILAQVFISAGKLRS